MQNTLTTSDSLIGSLCREIYFIRQRYKNIINSLENCRDCKLRERLSNEINYLSTRRKEITRISNKFNQISSSDVSNLFLHELCIRQL